MASAQPRLRADSTQPHAQPLGGLGLVAGLVDLVPGGDRPMVSMKRTRRGGL